MLSINQCVTRGLDPIPASRRKELIALTSGMTLRTKFIGGFAALLAMIVALTFTSMRAMSTLNAGLDRVSHLMALRADRTSQLVENLVDIAGRQQALLLHSILSDTAGVEQNRR